MEPLNCRIDRTISEVCISFQIPRVFLGLSSSKIHAQKKMHFPLNFANNTLSVFPPWPADHDWGKQFLRRMQKQLCGRK